MINFLYALGVFLSQFYVFRSGVPQPAHYLFLVAIFFTLYKMRFKIFLFGCGVMYRPLYIFIAYISFVNIIWSDFYQHIEFNFSSIYYIYGLMISLFVSQQLFSNNSFRIYFSKAIEFGIAALIISYFTGFGGYIFSPRYNGFFNDPNQMAFWVICSYAIFCLIEKNKLFIKIVLFFGCAFLVFASMSRSALLGLIAILLGVIVILFSDAQDSNGNSLKTHAKVLILSFFVVTMVVSFLVFQNPIFEVIMRFAETDFSEQADTRGYARISAFPSYLIFGAGQGLDERFNTSLEIHSTWAGVLFYYGILGLTLFNIFLYGIIKKLKLSQVLIISGPLFYSFSTFGLRTPIFWLLIAASVFAAKNNALTLDENNKNKLLKRKKYKLFNLIHS